MLNGCSFSAQIYILSRLAIVLRPLRDRLAARDVNKLHQDYVARDKGIDTIPWQVVRGHMLIES